MGINLILLFPIRVIGAVVLFLICIGISYLITFGLTKEDLRDRPLTGYRRKLRAWLCFLGRAIAFCFGFHHIRKIGRRATRSEAPIFVGGK